MSFWTYMLQCADGSFYVGHTDNLDARIGQHQSGSIPGYTRERRPVTLVWSEYFPSRIEALEAERRIKGWSRAKKLALIDGDWQRISLLARNRQKKKEPSTSSGRTAREGSGRTDREGSGRTQAESLGQTDLEGSGQTGLAEAPQKPRSG